MAVRHCHIDGATGLHFRQCHLNADSRAPGQRLVTVPFWVYWTSPKKVAIKKTINTIHGWVMKNGDISHDPGLCADPGFFDSRPAHSFACVDRAAAQSQQSWYRSPGCYIS